MLHADMPVSSSQELTMSGVAKGALVGLLVA